MIAAIEKGQYYERTERRDWSEYTWRCEGLSWEKGYGRNTN